MKQFLLLLNLTLILIGCSESFPDIGDGYKISYGPGGPFKQLINPQNTVIIKEHILDFDFDSNFIIIAQRPFDSVPECKRVKKTYHKCKKAMLKECTFHQFWIINKKEEGKFDRSRETYSNVYGPFNEDQYLTKRKELNVPDRLRLKYK